MANTTGLFLRGSSYYLCVVLPRTHPLRASYKNGKYVISLGACTHRESIIRATIKRAEVLGHLTATKLDQNLTTHEGMHQPHHHFTLRDVYQRWKQAKPRSMDSLNATKRALNLYEEFTGNPPIQSLTRSHGDGFRAWLQQPERNTASKTAKDRLMWVKLLLNYAYRDLDLLARHPWEGIDLRSTPTVRRRPWSESELATLFGQDLHTSYKPPKDWRAGSEAAYWMPILGLYTGARLGELAQLRVIDVIANEGVPMLSISDEGNGQQVKTLSGVRKIPIHSELIRLGFLAYVAKTKEDGSALLWSSLPRRKNKAGGYFSNWFGEYRRSLGLNQIPDFHCFRHTVRSQLAEAEVPEHVIDSLMGHRIKGSEGAKVYSHRSEATLQKAIEKISYSTVILNSIYKS